MANVFGVNTDTVKSQGEAKLPAAQGTPTYDPETDKAKNYQNFGLALGDVPIKHGPSTLDKIGAGIMIASTAGLTAGLGVPLSAGLLAGGLASKSLSGVSPSDVLPVGVTPGAVAGLVAGDPTSLVTGLVNTLLPKPSAARTLAARPANEPYYLQQPKFLDDPRLVADDGTSMGALIAFGAIGIAAGFIFLKTRKGR